MGVEGDRPLQLVEDLTAQHPRVQLQFTHALDPSPAAREGAVVGHGRNRTRRHWACAPSRAGASYPRNLGWTTWPRGPSVNDSEQPIGEHHDHTAH